MHVLAGCVLAAAIAANNTGDGDYLTVRTRLATQRDVLAGELAAAKTRSERAEVINRAQSILLTAITTELLPAWYGTRWAFHGTSDTPGEGEIACGMFIGTILEHAGFKIDRIALGRLAAEKIALVLTRNRNLKRYRDRPATEVETDTINRGPGLYLVGLDNHVAFIHVDTETKAHLIHSTVYGDSNVRTEPLTSDNPFTHSRYRVIAKLLDQEMTTKWLEAKPFH
jgi:hypothetical protein